MTDAEASARERKRELLQLLRTLAPGTRTREDLDNIVRAKTGGLFVFTDQEDLSGLISGGFPLDVETYPGLLYELAKIDGAIILNASGTRVRYANVQLVPDPSLPSSETGMRHRSAERMARQTGCLVIAISRRRDVITLYRGSFKHQLQDLTVAMAKANQALQTLEKYAVVLKESMEQLSALEYQDVATLYDVASAIRRVELALRVSSEVDCYIAELGNEGRLMELQREELVGEAENAGFLIVRDYLHPDSRRDAHEVYDDIRGLDPEKFQLIEIVRKLGYPASAKALETFVSPRGYRLLRKVPRLPAAVIENLVASFGNLPRILAASIEELDDVEGIGEIRARTIWEGLRRYQEQVLLKRRP